jgi:thioesterase domain-containing protein/acyl carrier protein
MRAISRAGLGLPSPYEAPLEGVESVIARAFAQALQVDEVGRNDNFFDLGGDSASGVQVVLSLEQGLGGAVPVSLLAEASTPRELAAALAGRGVARAQAPSGRPPIFCVHGQHGFMLPRKEFLAGLRPGQVFHMFELPGLRTQAQRLRRIDDIARAYVGELTAMHPSGPVHLAGFCLGNMIALEMAGQLADAGRPVARLVMVEPNVTQAMRELYERGLWHDAAAVTDYQAEARRLAWEQHWRSKHVERQQDGTDAFSRRHPGERFSLDARAKLMAAYASYLPRRLDMPVHVIACESRDSRLRLQSDAPVVWDEFIPNRQVMVVGLRHQDILAAADGSVAARIQAIFDA